MSIFTSGSTSRNLCPSGRESTVFKSSQSRNANRRGTSRRILSAAVLATPALFASAGAREASAASFYWDIDTTAVIGSGGATPSGTWNATNLTWNDLPDGSNLPGSWTPDGIAVFSADADATGAYSVAVEGVQSVGGLSFKDGAP